MEGVGQTREQVCYKIKNFLDQLMNTKMNKPFTKCSDGVTLQQLRLKNMHVQTKTMQILKWIRPAQECVKLNVDGSILGNPGRSGGGGILWDEYGHMIFSFVRFYGINSNNLAEIRALTDGLSLCVKMNIKQIEVEMDSKLVVNCWEKGGQVPWQSKRYWTDATEMACSMVIRLYHSFRETNHVTDKLPKLGTEIQIYYSMRETIFQKPLEELFGWTKQVYKSYDIDNNYVTILSSFDC